MKTQYVLALFFLFLILFLPAQNNNILGAEKYAWTTAENGLRVRDDASVTGKKTALIPYNTRVIILEEKSGDITIGGQKGRWTRIKSGNLTGWVFGGFLSAHMAGGFKEKAQSLYKAIKRKESISQYMSKNIILVYHADNRCSGNTDGKIKLIKPAMIDGAVELSLVRDGKGWLEECAENKVTKFTKKFDLRKEIHEWISDSNSPTYDEKKLSMEFGSEQYHIQFLFNKEGNDFAVYEIKYSDEDPG